MIRRAFTMRLKPDSLAEYKHHHDNIWPELVAEIERSGIASITTFQRDLDLFLVSEIADEAAWDKLWNSEVHKRWADLMQPLMHLRDDGIVEAGDLVEVFHLAIDGNGQIAVATIESLDEALAQVADALEGNPGPPADSTKESPTPAPGKRAARRKTKKPAAKKSAGKKKAPVKKVHPKKSKQSRPKKGLAKKKAAKKKPAAKKSKKMAKKKR